MKFRCCSGVALLSCVYVLLSAISGITSGLNPSYSAKNTVTIVEYESDTCAKNTSWQMYEIGKCVSYEGNNVLFHYEAPLLRIDTFDFTDTGCSKTLFGSESRDCNVCVTKFNMGRGIAFLCPSVPPPPAEKAVAILEYADRSCNVLEHWSTYPLGECTAYEGNDVIMFCAANILQIFVYGVNGNNCVSDQPLLLRIRPSECIMAQRSINYICPEVKSIEYKSFASNSCGAQTNSMQLETNTCTKFMGNPAIINLNGTSVVVGFFDVDDEKCTTLVYMESFPCSACLDGPEGSAAFVCAENTKYTSLTVISGATPPYTTAPKIHSTSLGLFFTSSYSILNVSCENNLITMGNSNLNTNSGGAKTVADPVIVNGGSLNNISYFCTNFRVPTQLSYEVYDDSSCNNLSYASVYPLQTCTYMFGTFATAFCKEESIYISFNPLTDNDCTAANPQVVSYSPDVCSQNGKISLKLRCLF